MVGLEEQNNELSNDELSYNDFIKLTGITALIRLKYFYKKDQGRFTSSGDFTITFDNKYLKMTVFINVTKKTINVSKFKSKGTLDHVFLRVLYSMQYYGTLFGYESIKITAGGYLNDPEKLIGYIVAGKYGFLMGINDESYFKKIAVTKAKTSYYNIYNMLLDSIGLEIWTQKGREWSGTFNLEVGSFSKFLIEDVLKRKKLKGTKGIISGL